MATHSSISCLKNPHGQRGLAGCSPWGRKECEVTEVTQHTHMHGEGSCMAPPLGHLTSLSKQILWGVCHYRCIQFSVFKYTACNF